MALGFFGVFGVTSPASAFEPAEELCQHAARGPGAVGETFYLRSKRIQHGNKEIRERTIFRVDEMLSGVDAAPTTSAEDNGQIMGVMDIPIAHPRPEKDHRIVKQRAFALLDVAQFAQNIGVLLHVPKINELVLSQFVRDMVMMRDFVVTPVDTVQKREALVVELVAERERANAGTIA